MHLRTLFSFLFMAIAMRASLLAGEAVAPNTVKLEAIAKSTALVARFPFYATALLVEVDTEQETYMDNEKTKQGFKPIKKKRTKYNAYYVTDRRLFLPDTGTLSDTIPRPDIFLNLDDAKPESKRATFVGVTADDRLAIVKISSYDKFPPTLKLASDTSSAIGVQLDAVGYHFGPKSDDRPPALSPFATSASITQLQDDQTYGLKLPLLSESIHPGIAGGPVVNSRCELVGVALPGTEDNAPCLVCPTKLVHNAIECGVSYVTVSISGKMISCRACFNNLTKKIKTANLYFGEAALNPPPFERDATGGYLKIKKEITSVALDPSVESCDRRTELNNAILIKKWYIVQASYEIAGQQHYLRPFRIRRVNDKFLNGAITTEVDRTENPLVDDVSDKEITQQKEAEAPITVTTITSRSIIKNTVVMKDQTQVSEVSVPMFGRNANSMIFSADRKTLYVHADKFIYEIDSDTLDFKRQILVRDSRPIRKLTWCKLGLVACLYERVLIFDPAEMQITREIAFPKDSNYAMQDENDGSLLYVVGMGSFLAIDLDKFVDGTLAFDKPQAGVTATPLKPLISKINKQIEALNRKQFGKTIPMGCDQFTLQNFSACNKGAEVYWCSNGRVVKGELGRDNTLSIVGLTPAFYKQGDEERITMIFSHDGKFFSLSGNYHSDLKDYNNGNVIQVFSTANLDTPAFTLNKCAHYAVFDSSLPYLYAIRDSTVLVSNLEGAFLQEITPQTQKSVYRPRMALCLPGGKRILIRGSDGCALVELPGAGAVKASSDVTPVTSTGAATATAPAPDANPENPFAGRVVVGGEAPPVKICSAYGMPTAILKNSTQLPLRHAVWSHDGNSIFMLDRNGLLQQMSAETFKLIKKLDLRGVCTDFALCSEGLAIIAEEQNEILLLNENDFSLVRRIPAVKARFLSCQPNSPAISFSTVIGYPPAVVHAKTGKRLDLVKGNFEGSSGCEPPNCSKDFSVLPNPGEGVLKCANDIYRVKLTADKVKFISHCFCSNWDNNLIVDNIGKYILVCGNNREYSDKKRESAGLYLRDTQTFFPSKLLLEGETECGNYPSLVIADSVSRRFVASVEYGLLEFDSAWNFRRLYGFGGVNSCALSPKGDRLALCCMDGVFIMDLAEPGQASTVGTPDIKPTSTKFDLRAPADSNTGKDKDTYLVLTPPNQGKPIAPRDCIEPLVDAERKCFYLLDGAGLLRKISLPGLKEEFHIDLNCESTKLMRSQAGLVVSAFHELFLIDPDTLKIKREIYLANYDTVAVHEKHALAVAVCSRPTCMQLLDLNTGRVLYSFGFSVAKAALPNPAEAMLVGKNTVLTGNGTDLYVLGDRSHTIFSIAGNKISLKRPPQAVTLEDFAWNDDNRYNGGQPLWYQVKRYPETNKPYYSWRAFNQGKFVNVAGKEDVFTDSKVIALYKGGTSYLTLWGGHLLSVDFDTRTKTDMGAIRHNSDFKIVPAEQLGGALLWNRDKICWFQF